MSQFKAHIAPEVTFRFGSGVSGSKFNGLVRYGPLQPIQTGRPPRFGFVFPDEYKEYANILFRSLKNGLGYFKGVERTFRFELTKERVYPISGFSLESARSEREKARVYTDAILRSVQSGDTDADLFFVLHDRTSEWMDHTPYYETKAVLLQHGILSQDVTVDLVRDKRQFEWSVGNIALASFAKMGGIPWAIDGVETHRGLVIGLGRSDIFDPERRQAVRYIGFTSCFDFDGTYQFTTLGNQAETREAYLEALAQVVRYSLDRAAKQSDSVQRLVLHVPKRFSREEWDVVGGAVSDVATEIRVPIYVVKVVADENYSVIDVESESGTPPAGLVAQVGDQEYVMYTEGAQERRTWRNRVPTALNLAIQGRNVQRELQKELIEQIYGMSQVNWRGFNAASKPITTEYSRLIARILAHTPVERLGNLRDSEIREFVECRPWFL